MRLLGLGSGIPLAPLARLFPLMWAGFLVNLLSGGGLWLADAVNKTIPGDGRQAPIFLTKMLLVTVGAVVLLALEKKLRDPEGAARSGQTRMLAGGLLVCWALAMIAGRLIAYASAIVN
jgi:hypothetical protein